MEKEKRTLILSIIFKSIVVIASFSGVLICFFSLKGFMGGVTTLLYFTIQSNIWIGLTCAVGIVLIILQRKNKKIQIKKWMYIVKFVFTVAITLTGVIFCFVLAPTMPQQAFNLTNILTHVIVPAFAIADFFVYDCFISYKTKDAFWATIPPLYYLGFSLLGFFLNWNFAGGNNFPYFFLNHSSPAGVFGFSKELPYFMGSFYWILLIICLVLSFSFLYLRIAKKIKKNNIE